MPRIIDAFTQFFDNSGAPLIDGFLRFYDSGTNNTDKATFADNGEQILNPNPVPLNASGRCPNVFGSGAYNVISYTKGLVQIEQFDPVIAGNGEGAFAIWNNSAIYNIGDLVTASNGRHYKSLVQGNQNQDPITSPLKWSEVQALDVWNTNESYSLDNIVIHAGKFYKSLTNLNVGNQPNLSVMDWEDLNAGGVFGGIAGGTADALTSNLSPVLTALTDGAVVFLKANLANTITTPTFNPNGLGPKTIVKNGSQALAIGDIARVDHELALRYNATNTEWELLNPLSDNIAGQASAAIAAADEVLFYDVSTSSIKKTTASDLTSGLSLISTQNVTSVALVDFTSGIDATYDEYVIKFSGVRPVTDGDNLRFRVFNSGTIDAGTSYGDAVSSINEGSTANDNGTTGNTYIRLDGTISGCGNATFKSCRGEIRISKPTNSAMNTQLDWHMTLISSAGVLYSYSGGGRHQVTATVDGFRFFFNGSNITEGTFSLYGVKK